MSGISAMKRRWTHLPFQLQRCLTEGPKTMAPGHLAPDGPGRRGVLSPHRGAKSHASLHAIDLAEDFWEVFFYLLYILPASPRCEP